MKKNQNLTYGTLNAVAAGVTVCTSALFILNAIKFFKK